MTQNRLNIINKNEKITKISSSPSPTSSRLHALKAKLERMWLIFPEQFNPLRNAMERERMERIWNLLTENIPLDVFPTLKILDIGCGSGEFSRRLKQTGAHVEALDIAENALKEFKKKGDLGITLHCEAMPFTKIPDRSYDIILCSEVIGFIPQEDYRLFFAEIARILRPQGCVLCSTAIDMQTEEGVERLLELAQTELIIIEETKSYHSFYLKLKTFLKTPRSFVEGGNDPHQRKREIDKRVGLSRGWYAVNSSPFFSWIWKIPSLLTDPLYHRLRQNRNILLKLEKLSRFFSDEEGVSHYMFLGKIRPLLITPLEEPTVKRAKKQEIWE